MNTPASDVCVWCVSPEWLRRHVTTHKCVCVFLIRRVYLECHWHAIAAISHIWGNWHMWDCGWVCSLLQLYSECQQGELCEIVKTSCKKKSILWTYNGGIFGQWRVKRVVNGTINVDDVLSWHNTVKLLNWKLLQCKLELIAENVADHNMGEYIIVYKIIVK